MNPVVEKAWHWMDPAPIRDLAKRCQAAGADALDINPGPLKGDAVEKMRLLVEAIQGSCGLPICLDTSNHEAIEAGLNARKGKTIINGFSLEPRKLEKILPLAKNFEQPIIGFLLHADGSVPSNAEDRLNLAVQLFEQFERRGLDPEKLIIDPVVVPLIWQDGTRQAMDVLKVISMLPDLLGVPVKTIVGLSNLTTGRASKDKKTLLGSIYLSMLAAAGLDMVLMDIFDVETVKVARTCEIITQEKVFSWGSLR